ncbi:MAG TPA: hypothetical protein VJN01_06205, partial [Xanthomonadales bacterium]|nr:hypothetical protein [Xanthomonadales bacterium]
MLTSTVTGNSPPFAAADCAQATGNVASVRDNINKHSLKRLINTGTFHCDLNFSRNFVEFSSRNISGIDDFSAALFYGHCLTKT